MRQSFYPIEKKISSVGEFVFFALSVLRLSIMPPFRFDIFLQQLAFVGIQSLNIILLTGFFTGAVFGLQIGGIFTIFKAEGMLGGATGIALAAELAPLVSGFLLAGRVGSAMTAVISTMKVNEQVDALEAMGVDPVHYLVVPRFLACLIMMPLLCGIFMFIGVIGAYVTGVYIFDVDQGIFFEKLIELVRPNDIVSGIRKMFFFSAVISLVSCQAGLKTSGGAKGVGSATTQSVVKTLVYILFLDLIISYVQIRWG